MAPRARWTRRLKSSPIRQWLLPSDSRKLRSVARSLRNSPDRAPFKLKLLDRLCDFVLLATQHSVETKFHRLSIDHGESPPEPWTMIATRIYRLPTLCYYMVLPTRTFKSSTFYFTVLTRTFIMLFKHLLTVAIAMYSFTYDVTATQSHWSYSLLSFEPVPSSFTSEPQPS